MAASISVLGIAIPSISNNLSIPSISAMTMMPGNQTGGGASNMTAGSASMTSTVKMPLEEGIKALKSGDTQGATTHLKAADKVLGGTS